MENIIFCDKNTEFQESILKEFSNIRNKYKIKTLTGDISKIRDSNICYFSPANSFLFFNGGVDAVYWNIFRDLQKTAQNQIKKYNHKTVLGRYYLPIGSAMMISVKDDLNPKFKYNYVVACPTMFRPQDVRGTRNVYWAFLAGLEEVIRYNQSVSKGKQIKTLVVPGLGTGYGKMTFQESAQQIREAFQNISQAKTTKFLQDPTIYWDEPNVDEQPNYYENACHRASPGATSVAGEPFSAPLLN